MLHTAEAAHRLAAAKQLASAVAVLSFCGLEACPDVRSYDKSHYALKQQPTTPFSKEDVPPSRGVHREANSLARTQK